MLPVLVISFGLEYFPSNLFHSKFDLCICLSMVYFVRFSFVRLYSSEFKTVRASNWRVSVGLGKSFQSLNFDDI